MANRVLFWDFHGTLTHADSLWSKSLHRAALAAFPGCGLDLGHVRACLDNDGFPWHRPEQEYQHLTEPEAWWAYVNQLFVTTCRRLDFDELQIREIVPRIRPQLLDPANFRLFNQTIPVLADLRRAGWRHVMLSNNFPELPKLCQILGLGDYFDCYVVSALAGFEKPRPEIFRIAWAAAGRPELCFMVGDNPEADIAGAQSTRRRIAVKICRL
jgi:putative hydrolase of the HAD superfamily